MSAKKSYPLRIDPALFAVLERWAADEFRSVNAHLEYVLREAARRAGRLPGQGRGGRPSGENESEPSS